MLHLIDETAIDFIPKTFEEAVVLFQRMRKSLTDHSNTPELLQHVCRALDQSEFNKFYVWVVSPSGEYKDPGPNVKYMSDEKQDEKQDEQDEKEPILG